MIRRVFVDDQPKVRTHHTPFSIEDIQSAVQEGRRAERERIIALLDEFAKDLLSYNLMTGPARHDQIIDAIALIKGESK